MEDSFRVRVDKVFGSLSSSTMSSMWSLTDEEIEKKEWNRDLNRHDDERIPCNSSGGFFSKQPQLQPQQASSSSNVGKELESDLQNIDDEDDEQPSSGFKKKKKKKKNRDNGDEDDELDVRSSIGLDCTLDYEEEEDEYDKVAIGKEKEGDRLFMKDVTDYGIDINTYHELPDSLGNHVPRDPRANHLAAKLRLKEDTEAAGNFHSLNLSDNSQTTTTVTDDVPLDHSKLEDDAAIPKPILKKRQNHMPAKSLKRVRFDPQFDDAVDTINHVEGIDLAAAPPPPNEVSSDDMPRSNLPDYLRNPSKYTRYTLDSSSEMDDESNRRAYMDFLNLIKKPTATDDTDTVDSSKPPTFTSRKLPTVKRENDIKQNQEDASQDRTLRIGIAAGDAQDSELYAMEEDEPEEAVDKSVQKPGRRYRTRTIADSEQQVT